MAELLRGDVTSVTKNGNINEYLDLVVTTMDREPNGYDTYRFSANLKGNARNLYTIYGTETSLMTIPDAYQVTTIPFGPNTGYNPVFGKLRIMIRWVTPNLILG
jgi:hypothetical protein